MARLLGGEAAELAPPNEAEAAGYDVAVERLEAFTNEIFDEQASSGDVSAFLFDLVDKMAYKPTPKAALGVARFTDELQKLAERYAAAGDDPYQQTFDRVLMVSCRFYERCPMERIARPRFEIVIEPSGKVHDFYTRVQVSGKVRDDGAVVRLLLTAESFSLAEVRATPYVLLHELIVHALAGPAAANHGKAFAEGWMDAVAAEVHNHAVCATGAFSTAPPFPDSAKTQGWGIALQMARGQSGKGVGQRLKGSEAARSVKTMLKSLAGPARAEHEFWTLSAALNRGPLAEVDREDLVEIVTSAAHQQRVSAMLAGFMGRGDDDPIEAAASFARAILAAV